MHTRDRVVPVTVRVTTLKGPAAGLYYVEALPSYYLDAGEPLGVWQGKGAVRLGLAGDVDDEAFLALMAGLHPDTGEQLGRRYGEHSARGYDATASAPKSVSVLFALGDDATRQAVLEAHDQAVEAMVHWMEGQAHTRYRIAGEVAVLDAEGVAAACFRQHTSRAHDPQLHTHVVIPNRVVSDDGRWLALDARLIKHDQQTLSAVYHAGLRAELTRTLGAAGEDPHPGGAPHHLGRAPAGPGRPRHRCGRGRRAVGSPTRDRRRGGRQPGTGAGGGAGGVGENHGPRPRRRTAARRGTDGVWRGALSCRRGGPRH